MRSMIEMHFYNAADCRWTRRGCYYPLLKDFDALCSLKHIRNFSIIAHIDHGKSTLSDRLIQGLWRVKWTWMAAQVLDSMDRTRAWYYN